MHVPPNTDSRPPARRAARTRRPRWGTLAGLAALALIGSATLNADSRQALRAGETAAAGALARASRAAEQGLVAAYASIDACAVAAPYTLEAPDAQPGLRSRTTVTFAGWQPPPRNSGFSAARFRAAHFDLASTATTDAHVSVILRAGAYQIAPRGR